MRTALVASLVWLTAGGCHHGETPVAGPTCTVVADHVLSLLDGKSERAKPIHDAFLDRCTKDGWPKEARACIVDESSLHGGRHCKDKLPGTARESLDHDLAEIDAPTPPPQCEEYTKVYEASLKCDKLTPAERNRIQAQYREQSQRWTKPGDRTVIAESCAQHAGTAEETMQNRGCEDPNAIP
jgi:hypothetical protein